MQTEQHISPKAIHHLVEVSTSAKTCLSIILPMAEKGAETRKNPIELKSALKEARRELQGGPLSDDEVDSMLAPAEKLQADDAFWQHQEAALALYLAPDVFSPFKLPEAQTRRISVGPRFFLRPLLQALTGQSQAYLLSLSQQSVQLFHYRRGALDEVSVPNLPKDLESALMLDPEQSLQGHTVARSDQGGPVQGAHGHGGGKDERLGHLRDFLTQVEKTVNRYLQQHPAPLFLATVEENEALYRKISDSEFLVDESLQGNFEHRSREDLLKAFEPVFEAHLQSAAGEVASAVTEAVAQGEGTTELADAVKAADEGRVRHCLVAADAGLHTGSWDPTSREVKIEKEASDDASSDLLDLVATESWEKGGSVLFTEREHLPDGADFAISYRYTY